ncbi:MAG: hypothetical protein M3O50_12665 [Myxococcota bacterium]|nr:hypothetical protein [Myxococcota bacterium]
MRSVPILFAPLFGLALGAVLAWIAAPELARDDGPIVTSRPFAVITAFASLVWLPATGYFLAFHGDWSYAYLLPWRRVPSAIDLGLVLVAAGAVVAGFALGVGPARQRRPGPVVALAVVPSAVALAGLGLAAKRLLVSGTYAQFHGDFGTEPLAASTLGKGIVWMGFVVALGLAWTVRAMVRMSAESGS